MGGGEGGDSGGQAGLLEAVETDLCVGCGGCYTTRRASMLNELVITQISEFYSL